MAESEAKSKTPYFMLNKGDNDCEDNTYQNQGPGFDNYQHNYGIDQYNNAYGNYFGYGPNSGFNQNFPPPYPGFCGFPPFQHPPGPPQGPQGSQGSQGSPDSSCNVSGQGFGAFPVKQTQSNDKIFEALISCGISKDTVKNLPRSLLKQYHPDHCGLCSQSLDTMAVARLHYVCRNHMKNQKKWLSQQTDSGFRRNKEQPLRARELYCEICDVHITSKAHSESHYAGKPHRAIVEGRKNPKNPFLMQPGMEDRLEQLIRREKKHIRLGEDEQTDTRDAKNTQTDLCCQICETSVTCTEQMIMHLNGKKHLAKEKHHILNMMKGGVDPASFRNSHASERENA